MGLPQRRLPGRQGRVDGRQAGSYDFAVLAEDAALSSDALTELIASRRRAFGVADAGSDGINEFLSRRKTTLWVGI
jgi:hypothetical protein